MHCEVRHDAKNNRLWVVVAGLLSEEEAREVADRIIGGVQKLRPGGEVVNDLSRFRPLSQASLQDVRRIAAAITEAGVRRLIRVGGLSPTAAMQVQRESQQAGYAIVQVATLSEAEALVGATSPAADDR